MKGPSGYQIGALVELIETGKIKIAMFETDTYVMSIRRKEYAENGKCGETEDA